MVKERSVVIVNGKVDIQCHLLTRFLCTIFQDSLTYGIKDMSFLISKDGLDPRMSAVKKSLKSLISSKLGGSTKLTIPFVLVHKDIEEESKFFPLCMQQLHQILKKSNRLRHHERFRYTLFLKDIGLEVNENIAFWEQYYSKPSKGGATSCKHTWAGSLKNHYKYSIRHVYGLEGGRINYSSHSCSYLQVSR